MGDLGSIPGLGSPGEGNGNPLQYSCLENPMDGGAWWATVHGVTKSRTQLSNFTSLQDVQEIKVINPKGNQLCIFIGRTDTEATALILWLPDAKNCLIGKDPNARKDCRQKENRAAEDEMVRWHHLLNGHGCDQTSADSGGQNSLEYLSLWSHKESDTT